MLKRLVLGALTIILTSPALPQTVSPRDAFVAREVAAHRAPTWWRDAKFGIFVHWGLYSVPGFAVADAKENDSTMQNDAARNPYAEWYYNTLRIPNSPTAEFHKNAYGANFTYYEFRKTFQAALVEWKPDTWADIFVKAGARYAVLTTKHSDGYLLWPSDVHHPVLPRDSIESPRDLVGEFVTAMRRHGIHPGLYYSSLFDWSVRPVLITRIEDMLAQQSADPGKAYTDYVDAQWRELINRYQPEILWSDMGYPIKGHPYQLVSDYFKAVPQGVVNDRWWPFQLGDYTTPEYSKLDQISERPWEMVRGVGKSFGLNRVEPIGDSLTGSGLIELLVDVVSKNGNLLLDVGPEPDGSLRAVDTDRLTSLGTWLSANGEAIYGTRPWIRFGDTLTDGTRLRYTTRGSARYAILLDAPKSGTLVLPRMSRVTAANLVGSGALAAVTQQGGSIRIVFRDVDRPARFAVIRLLT